MRTEFSALIKNSSAYKQLERDICGNFNHAYLLVSSDKTALDLLIEYVCLAIYCKHGGCLNCAECARVLKKSKPDIKEPNPLGGALKVEEIGEIVSDTYLTAFEKGKKLYIIRDMESISEKAQNKLLKTLEEPAANVHFILTTASPQGILPTVVSRSKQIQLGAFSEKEIAAGLLNMGCEREFAATLARCSGGSITTALRLYSDKSYFARVDTLLELLLDLNKSDDVVKHIMKPIFQGELIEETLDIIEIIFHDILYIANKISSVTFAGREDKLRELGRKYNSKCLAPCLSEIGRAKQKIRANCNKTNIADSLLMSILEVKNRCR
ncbi:MAG: hypothetical protein EOM87_06000 [Clostridia bacterium]|nr:hypothetical protein [Clostridia bacterium]